MNLMILTSHSKATEVMNQLIKTNMAQQQLQCLLSPPRGDLCEKCFRWHMWLILRRGVSVEHVEVTQ